MKYIAILIIFVLLCMGAEAKYSPALDLNNCGKISSMLNGTAAQDAVTFSQLVAIGSPDQDYAIAVYKSGTSVIAEFRNGTKIYTGTYNTNDARAINYAFSNLTAGRTWKERVVVRGNFRTEAMLSVPSYTIADFSQACISRYCDGGEEVPIMRTTQAATCVDFIGGSWDGRKASVDGGKGLELYYATNSTIQGVYVKATDFQGIAANPTGSYITFSNDRVTTAGNDGIMMNGVLYGVISNCYSYYNAHSGYDTYSGCSYITVSGGAYNFNGMRGAGIESAAALTENIAVVGATFYGNTLDGCMLATTGAAVGPRYVSITGCNFIGNGGCGIVDIAGWYNNLYGNQFRTNGVDGIQLQGTTNDLCSNNVFESNVGYAINEQTACVNTFSLGNVAWGNGHSWHIIGSGSTNDHAHASN